MTLVRNIDYYGDVAKGNVAGSGIMSALGERENMSTTVSGEDMWRGNELTPAPTSHTSIPIPPALGEQMTLVSESAADSLASTGIQTIRIDYLDASGDEQTEDVNLSGTTGVDTVATDIRFVNDMYPVAVGSGGVAAGHVKIYAKADSGLVYNMIAAGGNRSLVPNKMVPNGKNLILKGWHAEEAQDKRVAFRIRSTDAHGSLLSGIFLFKDVFYSSGTASGTLPCNVLIPSLSIVKVSGWGDAVGAEGSCSWWGELYDI